MTCIVGVRWDDAVYMGADSCAADTDDQERVPVAAGKLVELAKNGVTCLLGYTESFRVGQLLEHEFTLPAFPRDAAPEHYLIRKFVPAMLDLLAEHGYSPKRENVGSLLVGLRGRLWEIGDDFAVLEPRTGEMAIGSGQEYALGALAVTRDLLAPHLRVQRALEAAAEYSAYVQPPWLMRQIPREAPVTERTAMTRVGDASSDVT